MGLELPPSYFVVHRDKQGIETTYPIQGDKALIGRSSSSDICIASQFVSRRHALIQKDGERWIYRDLSSTSGSYLHGMRIREMPIPMDTWVHVGAPGGHAVKLGQRFEAATTGADTLKPDPGTQILRTLDLEQSRYVMGEITAQRKDLESVRRLGCLYELTAALTSTREQEKMYELILDSVVNQLPGERAAVIIKEPGASEQVPVAARAKAGNLVSFQPSRVLTGLVMRDQVGMVSRDAPEDERLAAAETLAFQAVRSVMVAPITSMKRVWGALYTDTLTMRTPYDDEMLEFLLAVGRQLGIALETLYLVSEQERMLESLMETLAASIDARDNMTSGHSKRVATYSRQLAERMGHSPEECKQVYWAGLLHDYGKIGVDDAVLRKPGKLNEEEFTAIKAHPQLTHDILSRIHFPEGMEDLPFMAATHHERLDGKGYPFGLSGDDFPETGQMIGIADVFDALTKERHYRDPMPLQRVIDILQDGKIRRWDPALVDEFLRYIDEELRDELTEFIEAEGGKT